MASGSSQSQYSANASGPWAGQSPFLSQLYSRANDLFSQGPYKYYPGESVAGFTPETDRAFGAVTSRLGRSDADLRAAGAENQRTLSGGYLNPESNPNLQRFADIGQRNITRGYQGAVQGLGSRLAASGRTGSGVHANLQGRADEALATGLGDFNAQLYGGAYEGERSRMSSAVGQGAGLAGARSELEYRDINALRGVGDQRQQQEQRTIDDLMARYEQAQRGGAEKLAEFRDFIGGPVQQSIGSGSGRSMSVGIFS